MIGATYSHSDNETVDNKLKSMRKKKRKFSLNRPRSKDKQRRGSKNGLFTRNKTTIIPNDNDNDDRKGI